MSKKIEVRRILVYNDCIYAKKCINMDGIQIYGMFVSFFIENQSNGGHRDGYKRVL